jgi:hypothetical protein
MKAMVWFAALAAIGGVAYWLWHLRERWKERNRASEDRFASFIAQALPRQAGTAGAAPAAAPKAHNEVVQQRLLLEAASKAGEAGEPALSIQLYAKLLSRYPRTSFAEQARAAVEVQKKKLAPRPA